MILLILNKKTLFLKIFQNAMTDYKTLLKEETENNTKDKIIDYISYMPL